MATIHELIEKIDNPELREQYAENAKKFSAGFYSRTVNTKKHIDLLAKLARK